MMASTRQELFLKVLQEDPGQGSGQVLVELHYFLSFWCSVVWCGVVWCGVVWCGVVVAVSEGFARGSGARK
jgi:hypothetical protein